jgi:hypothetical protein
VESRAHDGVLLYLYYPGERTRGETRAIATASAALVHNVSPKPASMNRINHPSVSTLHRAAGAIDAAKKTPIHGLAR